MMNCPYCKKKAEHVDTEESEGYQIELVYHCGSCNKDFVAKYEFEGVYDTDDNEIEVT